MANLWFKTKRYGWGWYPCSWEGWLVLFVAILGMVSNTVFVDKHSHSISDVLIGSIVTNVVILSLLVAICYATGEKPRWRWGGKD